MILAAIDIGSNAGRLLVANLVSNNNTVTFNRIAFVRVPLRLGMDVYSNGEIGESRTAYLIKTLQAFDNILKLYSPKAVRACATAAMREASNGEHLGTLIRELTGINIEIIDGITEAKIIRNALTFPTCDGSYNIMVDLGGGSTEITFLKGSTFISSESFKIGTVRTLNNKVPKGEWKKMSDWVLKNTTGIPSVNIIGSGGNINKLTRMYGDPKTLTINKNELQEGFNQLSSLSLNERIHLLSLKEDRADVIVPAAEFFLKFINLTNANQVYAPKIGLANGLLHQMYGDLSK